MTANLRKCPKGTRRNPKTRRCQPTKRSRRKQPLKRRSRRAPIKRKTPKRKIIVRRRRVVRRPRYVVDDRDPYHPYVPRGAYNPDRHWGLNYNMGRLNLNRPTGCGGRYRHQCDNSPNCQWNEYRNHCEARPEVFAGQRFEGPENRN